MATAIFTEPDIHLDSLLDKARFALEEVYNPDPEPTEPHELLAHVHASFEELRSRIRSNDGTKEDQIIELCSRLIGDVASVAVLYERFRQRQ